jgi:hypothetical protein
MLDRVLHSETFGRSERSRDFLKYLVDREQAGAADLLKGFAIAVDVFGKDAEFDPSTDAVVRVQARRLRDLLDQYYATEGAADPLRIVIARGSYVPAYVEVSDPARARNIPDALAGPVSAAVRSNLGRAAAPPAMPPQLMRHVRMFWASMAVIFAMLGFLIIELALQPQAGRDIAGETPETAFSTGSIASSYPVAALPVVHISIDGNDQAVNDVASIFRAALSGFDTIELVGRETGAAVEGNKNRELDFIFDIATSPVPGRVTVEIQHAATGKVLMSREFSPSEIERQALHDQIAGMLSAAVPASGVIYGFIDQNQLQYGLADCLLLNDDYYLDQTPERHRAAYECFERLGAQGAKSPLIASELAALHLEAVTDGYEYPPNATVGQALELAYRAVLAGPASPYAHRAYGFVSGRAGNSVESIRWTRKAYQLNTYDLTMAAAYGYALIYAGDYAEGTPIMSRAVYGSSAHPSWWDYTLFLGDFMTGDMDGASRATEPLASSERSHYLVARIITAHFLKDDENAASLISQLSESYPKFAQDPRAAFQKANYPADLTDKLVEALQAAGVGSAS